VECGEEDAFVFGEHRNGVVEELQHGAASLRLGTIHPML